MNNQKILEDVYKKYKKVKIGKNADYIPELKKINPNIYAISIFTVNGESYDVGDFKQEVAIESASKVFSLALALQKVGPRCVAKLIGTQQTSTAFNSVCAIEQTPNRAVNSFVNGGAMATTSISYEKNEKKFEEKIINYMSEFAGRKLRISYPIYNSEITHSDHNRAIAYLLSSYGKFYGDVDQTVEVYTKQCSVLVNSHDVAVMAATLANNGVNPKTKKKILNKENIPYILSQMLGNGMYEESETWLTEVGFPAKSGVGGVIIIVIPNVMGIGIVSPPLDKAGNSAKGILTAKYLAKHLKLDRVF